MIYITGDCHSDFTRFSMDNFPIQTEMTKDDYVIICGDFGGVWTFENESEQEKYWLDWLNKKNFTTLFVDGNHENFTRLYNYPEKKWHGGKVHKIRDSVLHLMRGEIFEIDNKRIFTFGGASNENLIKTYKEDVAVKVKNGLEKENSLMRKIKMIVFEIKQRIH